MGNARALLSYGLHAICTFAGGAGGGAFLRNRGFAAAFVRNGAGDYSLALPAEQAIDTTGTQYAIFASAGSGAQGGGNCDVTIVDSTHIRIRTGVDVAATDMNFSLMIVDLGVA